MKSARTYETYYGIVKEWCLFLGAEPGSELAAARLLAVSEIHAMAYIKWLGKQPGETPRATRKSGKAPASPPVVSMRARPQRKIGIEALQSNATIYKKVAALRRIYRMLITSALYTDTNPFDSDKVQSPPKDSGRKRPTEMIPFDRVISLIDLADDSTPRGMQDRAILACLFGGALRRSEVTTLRVDDVRHTNAGTVFLYLRATKAGKDARQALPEWAAKNVLAFLHWRVSNKAEPGDALFCSFRGKGGMVPTASALSNSGVYKLFKLYCRKAGFPNTFSPHSARATAITRLLASGIPHREVQEFSRHSSIQMVELYDKRRLEIDQSAAKKLRY